MIETFKCHFTFFSRWDAITQEIIGCMHVERLLHLGVRGEIEMSHDDTREEQM